MSDHENADTGPDPSDSEQGVTDRAAHTDHRAPEGEGNLSPSMDEGNDRPEMSVFDGKGNESVAVLGEDEDGNRTISTGPDRASAVEGLADPDERIGEDYSPDPSG